LKSDLEDELALYSRRLNQSLKTLEQSFRLRLSRAAHSYVFREPANLVRGYRQQLSNLEMRMGDLLKLSARARFQRLERAQVQMNHVLESHVQQAHQHMDELGMVMLHRIEQKAAADKQTLVRLNSQLRMLNPLAVLGRGYSLTRRADGTVVRSAGKVKSGDRLITQLADGKIVSNVEGKE
jgi:exodeoxyribonuclease VII large subunit